MGPSEFPNQRAEISPADSSSVNFDSSVMSSNPGKKIEFSSEIHFQKIHDKFNDSPEPSPYTTPFKHTTVDKTQTYASDDSGDESGDEMSLHQSDLGRGTPLIATARKFTLPLQPRERAKKWKCYQSLLPFDRRICRC